MERTKRDTALNRHLQFYSASARRRLAFAHHNGTKWTGYAAAAGASLAMASTAEAAVVHVQPQLPIRIELSDQMGTSTRSTSLDLNNDGQDDFQLQVEADYISFYASSSFIRRALAQKSIPAGNNFLLGSNGLIRNLPSGATISAGQPQTNLGILRESTTNPALSQTNVNGEWAANSSGIAGVQFEIPNSGTHFGWIRVGTESNEVGLVAVEIPEWAYEDVADTPIRAGAIPEPSTLGLSLLAAGAVGVAMLRRC